MCDQADTEPMTSFWWNRGTCAAGGNPPVEAVIFSLDGVLDDPRHDGDVFADAVWALRCDGIRVAIVTERGWLRIHRSVRDLLGDGAVEVLVTGDEIDIPKPDPQVYRVALKDLGLRPEAVVAVEDSAEGLRAARAAGLTTVVVTTERTRDDDFTGALATLPGYDGLLTSRLTA